ncbi:MAG TPA: hypothetical protein VD905_12065 [Flavobacteriales bacterium]|nr:hypothetical protein [Flavobacteriales bacterium]
MKHCLIITLCTFFAYGAKTQINDDSLDFYFRETKTAIERAHELWDKNIYGPVLFVDPVTRQVYANEADTSGVLQKRGNIYTGTLPLKVPVANTTVNWGGKSWAMIMLAFLKKDKSYNIALIAHELFHRSQASLGFPMANAPNNFHLDQKNGRIYLRLELEALMKAIASSDKKEIEEHVSNALALRRYRYKLFPKAALHENILELNEGLAAYTGFFISNIEKKKRPDFFRQRIDDFLKASFVQSFAYNTTPLYGFLLHEYDKYWNKKINASTDLTSFFTTAFNVVLPADTAAANEKIGNMYGRDSIISQESRREQRNQMVVAGYKNSFITMPHFDIPFEKKKVSFDARTIVTIEDKGLVYPSFTAIDNWGKLNVTEVGGLINPDRSKVTLTVPLVIDDGSVTGKGWELQLNPGYMVVKDELTGNFTLVKK